MVVGDFVIGQFNESGAVRDERMCLIVSATFGETDRFRLLFLDYDGTVRQEDLPMNQIRPAHFDFARLEEECDTQGDLSHLADLQEQRDRR